MATISISALEISRLAVARGGRAVIRDLSFTLESGQALALEGPNGAGKTSLLRTLGGFIAPLAGSIRLRSAAGELKDEEERGRAIGWLGHLDGLKAQLTTRENLAFYARLYGVAQPDLDGTLALVGLTRARDLPGQYLSAGMKRRLALARLHVCRRPLWLLDEPLAALDPKGKTLVAELIAAHCTAGGMVIAATHEPLGLDCGHLQLGGA